jgi:hypothetical protein
MKNPKIIGLTGPAGSGKDTVAQVLQTHCGFAQIAFADALRDEICTAFGIPAWMLTQRDAKEMPTSKLALANCNDDAFFAVACCEIGWQSRQLNDPVVFESRSPRQIMRWWGTEYRRADNKNWWTLRLAATVQDNLMRGITNHVISDVRFDNEAQLIREMGGQIWQIKRPGCTVPAGSHPSETDGSAFVPDVVIDNDQCLQHLRSLALGAWLMQVANLSFADLVRIGLSHVNPASAEYFAMSSMRLHALAVPKDTNQIRSI